MAFPWYLNTICPACGRTSLVKAVGERENPAILESICVACQKDVSECRCDDPTRRDIPRISLR